MARLKEQKQWDTFKRHTDKEERLRLWRVENLCGDGMSDVYGINWNGASFWLENKAAEKWPARATTCPLRDVFEPGQVPFMKQINFMNGHAYCLYRVKEWDEWFLIRPGKGQIKEITDMTRKDIETLSVAIGLNNIINHLAAL